MGILSALGFTKNDYEKRAETDAQGQAAEERKRRTALDKSAGDTRNQYVDAVAGFNPQAYMETAAAGVGKDLQEGLTRTQAESSQQLNARGFYGGGLNTASISRDFNDRLARALAGLSFNAANLEQGRIGMIGNLYGYDSSRADVSRGTELDLVTANRDAARQDRASRLGGTMDFLELGTRFIPGLG